MTKELIQKLVTKVSEALKLGDEINALKEEAMNMPIGVYLVDMPSGTTWAIIIKRTGDKRGIEVAVKPTQKI